MTMKTVAQRKRRKKQHVALGLGPTLRKRGGRSLTEREYGKRETKLKSESGSVVIILRAGSVWWLGTSLTDPRFDALYVDCCELLSHEPVSKMAGP
jgi:hypothetical protein